MKASFYTRVGVSLSLILSAQALPQPGSGSQYLGCYAEPSSGRALEKVRSETTMTPQRCEEICAEGSYPFYGVEYGKECWCGNTLNVNAKPIAETECTAKCAGDKNQICGGSKKLNVYKRATTDSTGSPGRTAGNFAWQGCYVDEGNPRALDKRTGIDGLTSEKCAASCAGYTYMGLQYGRECWCGNNLATKAFPIDPAACNMACAGDKTSFCGSGNRMDLYKVGSSLAAYTEPKFANMGCFVDEGAIGHALEKQYINDKMTPSMCANWAKHSGLKFFAVKAGRECWAGNAFDVVAAQVNSDMCNTQCKGDKSQFCGGSTQLTVYAFDSSLFPPLPPPKPVNIPLSQVTMNNAVIQVVDGRQTIAMTPEAGGRASLVLPASALNSIPQSQPMALSMSVAVSPVNSVFKRQAQEAECVLTILLGPMVWMTQKVTSTGGNFMLIQTPAQTGMTQTITILQVCPDVPLKVNIGDISIGPPAPIQPSSSTESLAAPTTLTTRTITLPHTSTTIEGPPRPSAESSKSVVPEESSIAGNPSEVQTWSESDSPTETTMTYQLPPYPEATWTSKTNIEQSESIYTPTPLPLPTTRSRPPQDDLSTMGAGPYTPGTCTYTATGASTCWKSGAPSPTIGALAAATFIPSLEGPAHETCAGICKRLRVCNSYYFDSNLGVCYFYSGSLSDYVRGDYNADYSHIHWMDSSCYDCAGPTTRTSSTVRTTSAPGPHTTIFDDDEATTEPTTTAPAVLTRKAPTTASACSQGGSNMCNLSGWNTPSPTMGLMAVYTDVPPSDTNWHYPVLQQDICASLCQQEEECQMFILDRSPWKSEEPWYCYLYSFNGNSWIRNSPNEAQWDRYQINARDCFVCPVEREEEYFTSSFPEYFTSTVHEEYWSSTNVPEEPLFTSSVAEEDWPTSVPEEYWTTSSIENEPWPTSIPPIAESSTATPSTSIGPSAITSSSSVITAPAVLTAQAPTMASSCQWLPPAGSACSWSNHATPTSGLLAVYTDVPAAAGWWPAPLQDHICARLCKENADCGLFALQRGGWSDGKPWNCTLWAVDGNAEVVNRAAPLDFKFSNWVLHAEECYDCPAADEEPTYTSVSEPVETTSTPAWSSSTAYNISSSTITGDYEETTDFPTSVAESTASYEYFTTSSSPVETTATDIAFSTTSVSVNTASTPASTTSPSFPTISAASTYAACGVPTGQWWTNACTISGYAVATSNVIAMATGVPALPAGQFNFESRYRQCAAMCAEMDECAGFALDRGDWPTNMNDWACFFYRIDVGDFLKGQTASGTYRSVVWFEQDCFACDKPPTFTTTSASWTTLSTTLQPTTQSTSSSNTDTPMTTTSPTTTRASATVIQPGLPAATCIPKSGEGDCNIRGFAPPDHPNVRILAVETPELCGSWCHTNWQQCQSFMFVPEEQLCYAYPVGAWDALGDSAVGGRAYRNNVLADRTCYWCS